MRGIFAKRCRNLDIRLGSCEGITDPWPTPSAGRPVADQHGELGAITGRGIAAFSNLVAACTGRSAGLSPRRMRST